MTSYLAGAGVGSIQIADFDKVEESNLHRQTLFKFSEIGQNKATTLASFISEQNPHIKVTAHDFAFNTDKAAELLKNIDLVIDATDNFTSKFLIHEKCHQAKIPLIQGSISSWQGQIHFFDFAPTSPCLECLYPDRLEEGCVNNCEQTGIMGSTAGVLGTLLANESIKVLIGMNHLKSGESFLFNLETLETHRIRFKKNTTCPLC